jgi:hypothetical protein
LTGKVAIVVRGTMFGTKEEEEGEVPPPRE